MQITLEQSLHSQGRKIVLTGHRPDKLGGYSEFVWRRLVGLAETYFRMINPSEIISGMALGWDTAGAWASFNIQCPLTCAIPFKGQENRWKAEDVTRYRDILQNANKIHYVCEPGYAPWKLQVRNEWMVDQLTPSDFVVALWDGSDGGTANCIKYCEKKGVNWINLWDSWYENSGVPGLSPFKSATEEKVIVGLAKDFKTPKLGYFDVFVDRTSPLGNPFLLEREKDRDLVIRAYEEWIDLNLRSYNNAIGTEAKITPQSIALLGYISERFPPNNLKISPSFKHPTVSELGMTLIKLKAMLNGGKKLRLLCHCYPKACHADVLKKYLLK